MTTFDTDQPLFPIAELVHATHDQTASIADRFAQFHADNGWVFEALEALCSDWLTRGHNRVGVKQMFEVIRWQYGRRTSGDQGFRCNNDFTSRYARLLIDRHPEWAEAIETRRLRAA